MIPWTTPMHTLKVKGIDLTAHDVYVDYRQSAKLIHVKAESVTFDGADTIVTVELTQGQTGAFVANTPVDVQVNWLTADGKRDATLLKRIDNGRNLYDRELSQDD